MSCRNLWLGVADGKGTWLDSYTLSMTRDIRFVRPEVDVSSSFGCSFASTKTVHGNVRLFGAAKHRVKTSAQAAKCRE